MTLEMWLADNGSPSEWEETSVRSVYLTELKVELSQFWMRTWRSLWDTGDQDVEASRKAVTFSRKLHYLLANLTTDTGRLIVRQNTECNGFETWRRLFHKFALAQGMSHF